MTTATPRCTRPCAIPLRTLYTSPVNARLMLLFVHPGCLHMHWSHSTSPLGGDSKTQARSQLCSGVAWRSGAHLLRYDAPLA